MGRLKFHGKLVVATLDKQDTHHPSEQQWLAKRQLTRESRCEDVPSVSVGSVAEAENLSIILHIITMLHAHVRAPTVSNVQHRLKRAEWLARRVPRGQLAKSAELVAGLLNFLHRIYLSRVSSALAYG
eukprot:CAMPEP_0113279866 /NCGR_PEP_ID=MMETSP0008_2-20120614/27426_1 /TAXON_ID=97485 /ORGANISM="Prymnesium parvum" /LENGTH=127 /DNA_ID=CAMNT_0000130105 /DNA_START=130 /DNA_END=509 /DNA_ORIENTATION=- /assembly_acc=CAM_ASM_000153